MFIGVNRFLKVESLLVDSLSCVTFDSFEAFVRRLC